MTSKDGETLTIGQGQVEFCNDTKNVEELRVKMDIEDGSTCCRVRFSVADAVELRDWLTRMLEAHTAQPTEDGETK